MGNLPQSRKTSFAFVKNEASNVSLGKNKDKNQTVFLKIIVYFSKLTCYRDFATVNPRFFKIKKNWRRPWN